MLRNGISDVTNPQIKHFTTKVFTGVRTRTRALKLSKTGIHSLRTHQIFYSSFMTYNTDVWQRVPQQYRVCPPPRDERALTFNKTRQKAPWNMNTTSRMGLSANYVCCKKDYKNCAVRVAVVLKNWSWTRGILGSCPHIFFICRLAWRSCVNRERKGYGKKLVVA